MKYFITIPILCYSWIVAKEPARLTVGRITTSKVYPTVKVNPLEPIPQEIVDNNFPIQVKNQLKIDKVKANETLT